jgi:hypothetical protein
MLSVLPKNFPKTFVKDVKVLTKEKLKEKYGIVICTRPLHVYGLTNAKKI